MSTFSVFIIEFCTQLFAKKARCVFAVVCHENCGWDEVNRVWRNVFVWTTTICLLHRFLLWLLWFMHVRRFTGLISLTPRLILRLETVFSWTILVSPILENSSTPFAFRFNFVAICMYFSWRGYMLCMWMRVQKAKTFPFLLYLIENDSESLLSIWVAF